MTIVLYDLKGRDGLRYSPYCWRIRYALTHKGLDIEDVGVGFTEKEKIAFSGQQLVPVIVDRNNGGKVILDSWQIANYLDDTYPNKPLFGSAAARGTARFINNWVGTTFFPQVGPMIIADLFQRVRDVDQPYFRASREKRYGVALEKLQEGREQRLPAFSASLEPLRMLVKEQDFICGETPGYADYILFGSFQWPGNASDFELLAEDDPIYVWRQRMAGLYDGLAQRAKFGPTN
ncbi:MAG: Glutathione S-transferase domain [Alphaproteobacteria bacterium]|jgi:glutathione S-transferase|nr:Glutathione S-transferase domain [Alphaproteobacteria bacterium]